MFLSVPKYDDKTCLTSFKLSRRIFKCQFIFLKKLTILTSKAELFEFYRVGVIFFLQIIPYFLFNKTFSEKKIFGVVGVVFFVYPDRKNELLALITFCMKIQTSAK